MERRSEACGIILELTVQLKILTTRRGRVVSSCCKTTTTLYLIFDLTQHHSFPNLVITLQHILTGNIKKRFHSKIFTGILDVCVWKRSRYTHSHTTTRDAYVRHTESRNPINVHRTCLCYMIMALNLR